MCRRDAKRKEGKRKSTLPRAFCIRSKSASDATPEPVWNDSRDARTKISNALSSILYSKGTASFTSAGMVGLKNVCVEGVRVRVALCYWSSLLMAQINVLGS